MSHHLEGLHPGPELSNLMRPLGTPNIVDADVFPPSRSTAPDPSIFLPFITEDIAFEEEYEEYLSDLGWADEPSNDSRPLFGGATTSAWDRLPFASDIADGISDSESVVSIGDLGDDSRLDVGDSVDENLNNWEVSVSKTLKQLRADSFSAHEPKNHGRPPQVTGRCPSIKFWWRSSTSFALRT
jgi:hypothetical protein